MGLFDFLKRKTQKGNSSYDRSSDYESAYQNNDLTSIELLIFDSIGINLPEEKLTNNHDKNSIIFNQFITTTNILTQETKEYMHFSFYNIGNEMQRRSNDEFAIKLYNRALFYNSNPSALSNMATSYKKIGDIQKSLEAYKLTFSSFPNYLNGYLRYLKVGLANEKLTFNECKEALDKYFMYGGTKENIEYFINDPQADIKERKTLNDFYIKYNS